MAQGVVSAPAVAGASAGSGVSGIEIGTPNLPRYAWTAHTWRVLDDEPVQYAPGVEPDVFRTDLSSCS
jgi:hypothetical protein